jgi:hypothetical protein
MKGDLMNLIKNKFSEVRCAGGIVPGAKRRGIISTKSKILPSPPLQKEGINLDYPVTLHLLGNDNIAFSL